MNDHEVGRLSVDGGEVEPAGAPHALRALAGRLRAAREAVVVPVAGGFVAQELTSGPLLVSLPGDTYRSPDSLPVTVVADWPGEPA